MVAKRGSGTRRKRGVGARIGVVVVAMALSVWSATPGLAQDAPITGVCSFPIAHDLTKDRTRAHEFIGTNAPFEFMATGQYFVKVTNLVSGESVTVNSSGAFFLLTDERTVLLRGQVVTLFLSQHGDIPKGVWLSSGSLRSTLDEDGHVLTTTGGVLRRDICAELA